ncbi:hypothetical protein GMMP1_1410002 [Candidatus Magnetomoraceae bacterium gMMP-1]
MIKSFSCRETEKIFHREFSSKFPRDIQQRAFMKLNAVDSAAEIKDLRLPPSNRLEKLKGLKTVLTNLILYHIIYYYGDVNAAINILTESLKQEQYI